MNQTFINQGDSAKNFYLDHIASFRDTVADFAHVNRVVITFAASPLINHIRVFPSLYSLKLKTFYETRQMFFYTCGRAP